MDFVAYNEILICDKPIRNKIVNGITYGYSFEIRYPSYRGCYLSNVEELWFELDGVRLDDKEVYFGLNGKEFTMDKLPDLFREYWYVMTPAEIRVMKIGGLEKGRHALRVHMKHRVPYTGYFGQYLTLISDRTADLCAV